MIPGEILSVQRSPAALKHRTASQKSSTVFHVASTRKMIYTLILYKLPREERLTCRHTIFFARSLPGLCPRKGILLPHILFHKRWTTAPFY